jgi:hypothetical protein
MYPRLANFKVTVPKWTCHPDSSRTSRAPGGPAASPGPHRDLSATGPPDVQVASGSGTSGSLPQWPALAGFGANVGTAAAPHVTPPLAPPDFDEQVEVGVIIQLDIIIIERATVTGNTVPSCTAGRPNGSESGKLACLRHLLTLTSTRVISSHVWSQPSGRPIRYIGSCTPMRS